jgi:hypothetical protein
MPSILRFTAIYATLRREACIAAAVRINKRGIIPRFFLRKIQNIEREFKASSMMQHSLQIEKVAFT